MNKRLGSLVVPGFASCLIFNTALSQQTQDYEPIVKVAPVYPETALGDSLEGHVVIEYTVTEEGTVENARIAESSNAVFDEAAIDSVRKFKYRPRILNGEPVAVRGVRARVLFRMPVEH